MDDLSQEELHEAIRFATLSKQHLKALHFQKALYFQSKKYILLKRSLDFKTEDEGRKEKKNKNFYIRLVSMDGYGICQKVKI